jgi:hypothetical protein
MVSRTWVVPSDTSRKDVSGAVVGYGPRREHGTCHRPGKIKDVRDIGVLWGAASTETSAGAIVLPITPALRFPSLAPAERGAPVGGMG